MDQRERLQDVQEELLRTAFESMLNGVWTAIPGVIVQFPSASGLGPMIADVQPTVNAIVRQIDGSFASVQRPVLLDCPVQWLGGGGVTATFPIKAGDECLVVFSARCIDAWFQRGFVPGAGAGVPVAGGQAMDPPELRQHDMSDGICIVGLRSLPRQYAVDPNNACLITDDGQAYFKLNPSTHAISILANGGVNISANGGINLNGVQIDSSGDVTTSGNVMGAVVTGTNDVKVGTVTLKTHIHADPQGGTVGPPTG